MNKITSSKGGRLLIAAAVTFTTLVLLLGGWAMSSGGPGPGYQTGYSGRASAPVASPMPDSKPVRIDVHRIGARSSLVELGLRADRTLDVPPVSQPMQAGWYRNGPTPGEPGPAVIAGHVDGKGKAGIFHRLHELVPGDVVDVRRQDGTTARFGVQRVERVPKSSFPTQSVYGSTPDAQLRLITCGGSFDSRAHSYRDNVIVYANLLQGG
ncbi:sortase family protein [Saccharopolyspora erythraea NRRL 2338]|uniref:Peptidase C60, sortase A and B n=2 Tax=Saccharopolyspora erythraea TaxID=1836 RepID=A4FBY6_SACEN|nr:class F sortase [Saccharopolyspora erythraea]EQD84085.1 peptidase C60 [Saccharopolyspora erythraea D]PFG95333.1 sortase family protein [Saccharopolyspora erythraea NRRL 2338]QRK91977.1 class F sortase [Saccharopolyspora erythraea]CAM01561.1 peptidase C60, sortase A and B [Saccharopolyspora erythraea NRRL 2338]